VGQDDYLYYGSVTELAKILKQNNARVKFQSVPGMGHSIAVNSYMIKSVDFFNRANNTAYDLDLFKVGTSSRQCNNMIQATAYVYNPGDSMISSIDLDYSFGTDKGNKKWNGTLMSNNSVAIPLTLNIANGDVNDFKIRITGIENGKNDEDTSNNLFEIRVNEFKAGSLNTVQQGFETENNGWDILPTGSVFEWYIDPDIKRTGVSSMGTFNTILLFYSLGSRESFVSPFINISSLTQKSMTFDVAYNFHRYTPPYVTTETDFADTLEVLISTDCGATYSSIYRKGGQQLATVSTPIVNPLSVQDCFFAPTNDQWRTEILDLGNFSSIQNALFKFDYISGMGGAINIDNVNLGTHNLSLNTVSDHPVRIFPNPANTELTIDLASQEASTIKIYNSNGVLVYTATSIGKELFSLNVGHLNSGIYSIEIVNSNQVFNDKLLVVR
jgi:hypothetical protein